MNLTPFVIFGATALLPLCLAGCKPQSADPRQLTDVLERNAQLRSDINHMEALIHQAGDPEPDLAERIAQRKQEVEAAKEELKQLYQRKADQEVRAIHLEARLEAFQDNFTRMQEELHNSPQP